MAIVETIPDEGEGSSSLRNRQNRGGGPSIPLVHPFTLPSRPAGAGAPLIPDLHKHDGYDSREDDDGEDDEDEEQDGYRQPSPTPSEIDELLRTGALKVPQPPGGAERERDVWDEVFDTALLTIPFSFLYILLDILVYLQYSFRPKLPDLLSHSARAVPTLGLITWYTSKYASHPATTPLLMFASVVCGTRLIWLMNMASWGVVTAQAPAMGAMWTLTIVQLPLSRAVLCLAAVAGWTWYTGMKLQT